MHNNNYIVHLVENWERLVEIMREGFVPNYHKEDLSPSDNEKDKFVVGIPMTSFADVPVDQIEPLMKEYGKFGIVMSKLWALEAENLSPVHYIADMRYLDNLIKDIDKGFIPLDFIRYTKKYISEWNGRPYLNYIEREWRHALPNSVTKWYKSEEEYNTWRYRSRKRPAPTEVLRRNALIFDVKDIVGIILNDEKDKRFFMNSISAIRSFSGGDYKLSITELSYLESTIKVLNKFCE